MPTSSPRYIKIFALTTLAVVTFVLSCKGRDTTGPSAVESVSVAPSTASFVAVGLTEQLTATPRDAGGDPLADEPITWTSSDSAIATVSASGLVTGVGPGTAGVTATSLGRSGTATIIVQLPLAALTMSQTAATIASGATLNLTATPSDSAGDVLQGLAIKWTSSNTGVAIVNSTGTAISQIMAVAAGTTTITATSGGVSGSVTITVVAAAGNAGQVASVAVRPSTATFVDGPVGFGAPLQLTAYLADASGNALAGLPVTWSSSDTTAATVTQNGLLTPNPAIVALANVTITATSEGISATSSILVSPQVMSISVAPTSLTIALGQNGQLVATPMDVNGHPLPGVPISWTNYNANIVRLERMGDSVVVVPVVAGVARIVAGAGNNGAIVAVEVTVTDASSLSEARSDDVRPALRAHRVPPRNVDLQWRDLAAFGPR